jgi:hypothetical protein
MARNRKIFTSALQFLRSAIDLRLHAHFFQI